jgi:hypothetical protein
MTYKESLDIAFLKTDSESSDYDSKIFPVLANEAQMFIAKYGTHIVRRVEYEVEAVPHRAKLPEDFYKVALRGMVQQSDELKGVDYFLAEDGYVLFNEKGKFNLYYYALPKDLTKLTDEELDTYEFEVADHTQIAIPSYIGYQLVKSDDVQIAQILMDEWNKYLSLFDDKVKTVYRKIGR